MIKTRVFKSGDSLAVRLPKEFAVDATELYIERVGDTILLRETHDRAEILKEALGLFTDDFMSTGRMQPHMPDTRHFDVAADDTIFYDIENEPSDND